MKMNRRNFFKYLFKPLENVGCTVLDCYQGRNCSCCSTPSISFGESIREVHKLATRVEYADISIELRRIGDRLAQLGNQYQERQYPSIGAQEKNLED